MGHSVGGLYGLILLLQIYGFLVKDTRIYMIGERKKKIDTQLKEHIIELRRLTLGGKCGRLFPITSSDPFDIDACSLLIARASSEIYSASPLYQPFEGLLAVPAAEGSAVDIYLQVIHFNELNVHNFTFMVAMDHGLYGFH